MDRREFLATLLFGSTSVFSGAAEYTARRRAPGGDDLSVTHIFSDVSDARAVGSRYLAMKDVNRATLLDFRKRIFPAGPSFYKEHGWQRVREELRKRIRGDYQHSRCVCVDGWILSITEARLCALVAL